MKFEGVVSRSENDIDRTPTAVVARAENIRRDDTDDLTPARRQHTKFRNGGLKQCRYDQLFDCWKPRAGRNYASAAKQVIQFPCRYGCKSLDPRLRGDDE